MSIILQKKGHVLIRVQWSVSAQIAGHSLAMALEQEQERQALAAALCAGYVRVRDKYYQLKEETHERYNYLSEKVEELEENVLTMDKCQVKTRENGLKKIEQLERLMECFPEQLELNEKVLEDIMAKIDTLGKKKSLKGSSVLGNDKLCKQEFRSYLTRIETEYPEEKKCLIPGEGMCWSGTVNTAEKPML